MVMHIRRIQQMTPAKRLQFRSQDRTYCADPTDKVRRMNIAARHLLILLHIDRAYVTVPWLCWVYDLWMVRTPWDCLLLKGSQSEPDTWESTWEGSEATWVKYVKARPPPTGKVYLTIYPSRKPRVISQHMLIPSTSQYEPQNKFPNPPYVDSQHSAGWHPWNGSTFTRSLSWVRLGMFPLRNSGCQPKLFHQSVIMIRPLSGMEVARRSQAQWNAKCLCCGGYQAKTVTIWRRRFFLVILHNDT